MVILMQLNIIVFFNLLGLFLYSYIQNPSFINFFHYFLFYNPSNHSNLYNYLGPSEDEGILPTHVQNLAVHPKWLREKQVFLFSEINVSYVMRLLHSYRYLINSFVFLASIYIDVNIIP